MKFDNDITKPISTPNINQALEPFGLNNGEYYKLIKQVNYKNGVPID